MNETVNRQILLVEKPSGKLGPEHFKLTKGTVPEPKDGEVLVRTRYISLDAANRAWMHGATYRAAVEANTVMAGGGIAEVVSSKSPDLKPGDIVVVTAWETADCDIPSSAPAFAMRASAAPASCSSRMMHCVSQ